MRITCIKCQAVYSVDDSLVAGGPVKAQCPACGDIQVVKVPPPGGGPPIVTHNPSRPPINPTPMPGIPQADGLPDMSGQAGQVTAGAPPPPPKPKVDPAMDPDLIPGPEAPVPASGGDPFADLDSAGGSPIGDPFQTPSPAPDQALTADPFTDLDLGGPGTPATPPAVPQADPFDQLDLTGNQAMPTGTAQNDPFADLGVPSGAATPGPPPLPSAKQPPAPAPSPGGDMPPLPGLDKPGGKGSPISPGADADRCDRCGGVISEGKGPDGLCSRCRSLVSQAGQPADEEGLLGARDWRVRKPDGVILGPLTLNEVRLKFQEGEIEATDRLARGEGDFRLISSFPEFAMFFKRPGEAIQPVFRTTPPSHALRNVLIVLVLLLAGGGVAAYLYWDELTAMFAEEKQASNVVEEALESFSAEIPAPSGTSAEAVARGREQMRQDDRLSYMDADREFKKALILDPTNMQAYAGWVQNRALLDLGAGEVSQRKVALDLVDHALERAPDLPELLRAKAYLLFSLGRLEDARKLATKVLGLIENDPETELIIGATFLESSTELAVKRFERALEGDPKLNLAFRMLGEAKIRLGQFREALRFFEQRLEKDPGQFASLDAMARVYVTIGKFGKAEEVYERILGGEPHRIEAAVSLVRLQAQFLNKQRSAQRMLTGMLKASDEEIGPAGRAQLLAEQSVLLRLGNKLKKASEVVEQALKLDPMLVPAIYSKAWLSLRAGDVGQAIVRFKGLRSHIPESSRVQLLIAEAEAEVPNFDSAIKSFQRAVEAGPNDLDGYLMLASLHLELDNPNQAYTWLRRATGVDPFWEHNHRAPTPYFDGPDLLRSSVQRVENAADKYPDDALAQALAGAVLLQAGQTDKAQGRLLRALGIDEECFPANLYMGALLLGKGQARRAVGYLQQARKSDSLHSVAAVLLAYGYLQSGNAKQAGKLAKTVLKPNPGNLSARLCLAEAQLARRQRKQALANLLKVYEGDPAHVRAKELLFQLGR